MCEWLYVLPMLSVINMSKVLFSKCICLFTICCFICFWHTFKWWYGFSKTPWLIPVLTHHQTVHSEYIESTWPRLKIGSYSFDFDLLLVVSFTVYFTILCMQFFIPINNYVIANENVYSKLWRTFQILKKNISN